MIASLNYISVEEWEQSYKLEVIREADVINDGYTWWSEPVMLYDQIGKEDFLTGGSNFTLPTGMLIEPFPLGVSEAPLPLETIEIELADQLLLQAYNCKCVVDVLCRLGEKYEFSWDLSASDDLSEYLPLGRIIDGKKSDGLTRNFHQLIASWLIDESLLGDEAHMKSLIHKYHERFEKAQEGGLGDPPRGDHGD